MDNQSPLIPGQQPPQPEQPDPVNIQATDDQVIDSITALVNSGQITADGLLSLLKQMHDSAVERAIQAEAQLGRLMAQSLAKQQQQAANESVRS